MRGVGPVGVICDQTARLIIQQIRAVLPRSLDRLLSSPPLDFGMISGKQDIGDFPAAKLRRARVLRRFQ